MTDTDPTIQEVPCIIHLLDGKQFVVADVGAWKYEDWGIFASGRWRSFYDEHEQDVLIPYSRIEHLEFDFAALERYHASQLIESVTRDDEPEPFGMPEPPVDEAA